MTRDNKDVALTYLKALGEGDPGLMDTVLADDFETMARGSAMICGLRNREDVLAFLTAVPSIFKNGIRFETESVTAEEGRVVCQVKGFSTLANGTEYNNEYIFLFQLRDGKIYHMDEYIDTKLAEATLGSMMGELGVS
ncbi:nuclear transport factor 2 family protein [Spirillospora sp. CA-255316]